MSILLVLYKTNDVSSMHWRLSCLKNVMSTWSVFYGRQVSTLVQQSCQPHWLGVFFVASVWRKEVQVKRMNTTQLLTRRKGARLTPILSQTSTNSGEIKVDKAVSPLRRRLADIAESCICDWRLPPKPPPRNMLGPLVQFGRSIWMPVGS